MSIKDKIIFGLIVVLLIGGGYIQYTYTQLLAVMEVLASEQLYSKATIENPIIDSHVDEINAEFREDLRTLNLQFIGRGKHVARNRDNVAANLELIKKNTDSLATMISDVQFNLEEFQRETNDELSGITRDIRDVQDSFSSYRRRVAAQIAEVQQSISTLQADVNKLNEEVFEKEKDEKRR